MQHTPHTRGFTVVELAIVITIIGLLIGGVLSGKALMRNAMLANVVKEAQGYVSGVGQFKMQYNALPGDFARASSYWDTSTTSNGNGDTQITGGERFTAWNHLYQASLSPKKVTGAQGAGGAEDFVIDSNSPGSRLKGGGYALYHCGLGAIPTECIPTNVKAATTTSYALKMANMLTLGGEAGTNNGPPINAILTPNEAYYIDSKTDDGIPGTGKWIANLTGGGNFGATSEPFPCVTGANTDAGAYNTAVETVACSFFISTGY